MTTIAVGWFGSDIAQNHVAKVSETVDGIKVDGRLWSSDPGGLLVLRDQLIGLAQQAGQAVPVTIDTAPHLDGWYYVTDAQVDLDRGGIEIGYWPYSLTLAHAGLSSVPVLEARIVGARRSNGQSRTTSVGWQAVPAGSTLEGGPTTLATPTTRATADGPVTVYTAGQGGLLDSFLSWRTPPAVALAGGARIAAGPISSAGSDGFGYTGATASYVVPAGITRLRVDVRGGAGGGPGGETSGGGAFSTGARGARVVCELAVTAGETLTYRVGQAGQRTTGGFNGGGAPGAGESSAYRGYGGGGRTQILRGTTDLVVAGAGGGIGAFKIPSTFYAGGAGGGHGVDGAGPPSGGGAGSFNGGYAGSDNPSFNDGTAGTAGTGGVGGGNATTAGLGAGGGGGGLYGGGGGEAFTYFAGDFDRRAGSGGGGSSKGSGVSQTLVTGFQAGDGEVIITPVRDVLPVDRHKLTGVGITDAPFGWELANGIIKVTPAYRGDALNLDVAGWNGSKWSPMARWQLTDNGVTTVPAAASITGVQILANTMDRCSIRVSLEAGAKALSYVVTLTLRRGSPLVDVRVVSVTPKSFGFGISGNATAVTGGGLVATTADADGNKWLMTTTALATSVLSGMAGWYQSASDTSMVVGLGFLPAGFGTVTAANLVEQWFAATSASIRAVAS